MVLVRSESGQLLMIPQQALAQMQAQAQGAMAARSATPTNVPLGQVRPHRLTAAIPLTSAGFANHVVPCVLLPSGPWKHHHQQTSCPQHHHQTEGSSPNFTLCHHHTPQTSCPSGISSIVISDVYFLCSTFVACRGFIIHSLSAACVEYSLLM